MRNFRVAVFLTIILCILSISGCGGAGRSGGRAANLAGLVVDSDFAPLSGVNIVAGSHVASSNSDGSYAISAISNGTYVVTLSKAGYTTSYRKITVSGGTAQVPLAILTPLDSKTTMLGSSGGIASNSDGSVKIDIPALALSGSTAVSLTRVEVVGAPYPPPAGSMFVAVIIYISPSGTDISPSTATITLPNLTGLANGTAVPFWHFNVANADWEFVANGVAVISSEVSVITAEASQFGWTAAIVPYSPNAGNISGVITDATTLNPVPFASVWFSSFFTVADSSGTYTLSDLPTGEATVEAIAAGYNRNSTTVTVVSGSTVTADIAITPLLAGTITGKIYDSLGFNEIAGARVSARGLETTTDNNGNYTLYNVTFGSFDISAYAGGYLSTSESITLSPGETKVLDLYLTPTSVATQFAYDFETDEGWNDLNSIDPSCKWQRINHPESIVNGLDPTYVTLPDAGSLPSAESGTWAYWFGVTNEAISWEGSYIGVQSTVDTAESGGTTSGAVDIGGTLDSPSLDLRNFVYGKLSFWTWWELESEHITQFDLMNVWISIDNGATWPYKLAVLNPVQDPDQSQKRAFLPYSSGGFDQSGAWVRHQFDLTPYVGNIIKIRFEFVAGDRLYNGFRGWLVDNVVISPEQVEGSAVSASAVEKRPDRGIIQAVPR